MPEDARRELLLRKVEDSKQIALEALRRYGADRLAVAWTGGKDSTLTLYTVRLACQEAGIRSPAAL